MKKSEKKQKTWDDIYKNLTHLDNYCTIELKGLDEESDYFHPHFILSENTKIVGQCDIANKHIYALNFYGENHDTGIEIYNELLEPVIIGYYTNKESVSMALNTMKKVKNHVSQLHQYCNDYVHNSLLGDSLNEISNNFINEIKTTTQLISFMQNKTNKI